MLLGILAWLALGFVIRCAAKYHIVQTGAHNGVSSRAQWPEAGHKLSGLLVIGGPLSLAALAAAYMVFRQHGATIRPQFGLMF